MKKGVVIYSLYRVGISLNRGSLNQSSLNKVLVVSILGFKKGFSFSKMETLMVCSQHISGFWSFQRDIQHEK